MLLPPQPSRLAVLPMLVTPTDALSTLPSYFSSVSSLSCRACRGIQYQQLTYSVVMYCIHQAHFTRSAYEASLFLVLVY